MEHSLGRRRDMLTQLRDKLRSISLNGSQPAWESPTTSDAAGEDEDADTAVVSGVASRTLTMEDIEESMQSTDGIEDDMEIDFANSGNHED